MTKGLGREVCVRVCVCVGGGALLCVRSILMHFPISPKSFFFNIFRTDIQFKIFIPTLIFTRYVEDRPIFSSKTCKVRRIKNDLTSCVFILQYC